MTVTQENVRQHEIEIEQWPSFIDTFVHAHEKQAATLEIYSATGSLLETRSGQLRGLKLDGRHQIQRAFLELHQPMYGNIACVLACPVRMIVREGAFHRELEITSSDGRKTLLQVSPGD